VNVGGQKLNLNAKNYISIRHASNKHTYCQFRCGINNLHFTNNLGNSKTIIIPYGFNTSIHTLIHTDPIKENYVNVPEYLEINTPNQMADDVNKLISILYGLNIRPKDTKFSFYNANESKKIVIPKGTLLPISLHHLEKSYKQQLHIRYLAF
jgi:hypothetical protein